MTTLKDILVLGPKHQKVQGHMIISLRVCADSITAVCRYSLDGCIICCRAQTQLCNAPAATGMVILIYCCMFSTVSATGPIEPFRKHWQMGLVVCCALLQVITYKGDRTLEAFIKFVESGGTVSDFVPNFFAVVYYSLFLLCFWHCLVGWRESWVLVCSWWWLLWSFARLCHHAFHHPSSGMDAFWYWLRSTW